ncbi:MAG: VCBS repeat-containing protein [Planctomycetes bacterium]|nr:VCBS repeat-containing protein [Planctomycetota bacterium]
MFQNPALQAALILSFCAPLLSAQSPYPYPNPALPGLANSMVLEDINNDGRPDLIATYNGVQCFLGQTGGKFSAVKSSSSPILLMSLSLADLNGDGKADALMTTNNGFFSANDVAVSLGDGTGLFGSVSHQGPGLNGSLAVAPGDFDLDGRIDAAAISYSNHFVMILLGDGTGNLNLVSSYNTNSAPNGLATEDLNHDGRADVAIAHQTTPGSISILLALSNGNFTQPVSYAAGVFPTTVFASDADGDGNRDLISINYMSASALRGDGTGGFTALPDTPFISNTQAGALGDFNGDGDSDLITLQGPFNGQTGMTIYYGNHTGMFNSGIVQFDTGGDPRCVVIGDFTGDGRNDIAAGIFNSNLIGLFINDGAGGVGPAIAEFAVGSGAYAIETGDLNGDGYPDVVNTNQYGPDISVLINNGAGSFANAVSYTSVVGRTSLALGDLNNDGALDAVASSSSATGNAIVIFLGDGAGGFGPAYMPPFLYTGTDYVESVRVADVTQEGTLDLITANHGFLQFAKGNGDGTFQSPVTFAGILDNAYSVAAADFNNDGRVDVASGDASIYTNMDAYFWFGTGPGTFGPARAYPLGAAVFATEALDANADGMADLAFFQPNYISLAKDLTFAVNQGSGHFAPPKVYDTANSIYDIAVQDVQNDGKLDLLSIEFSAAIVLRPGRGNAAFGTGEIYNCMSSVSHLAAADFNQDGKPDIAATSPGSNAVILLLHQ